MRIKQVRDKVPVRIRIPGRMRRLISHAYALIQAGDDAAFSTAGDLIQTEGGYGGLLEVGGSRYQFRYFPRPNTRTKWNVELSVSDIARVHTGETKTLQLWGCADPRCGCLFPSPD